MAWVAVRLGKRDPSRGPPWQAIPCPFGALALPLGGERTRRYAQRRVAVQRTLPPSVERTETVRSGPSGSASGTLGGEWQCISHCHSMVNVPRGASHTATRRRAYRNGTIRVEWQCAGYTRGRVAVRLTLPLGCERTRRYVQGRVAVQADVACDPLTHSNCADAGTYRSWGVPRPPQASCGPICRPGGQSPRQKPRAPQRR